MDRRRLVMQGRGPHSPGEWVSLWARDVVANGGTVSEARAAIVRTFVAAEMGVGNWGLADDYWANWAENEAQRRTSLKQRRLVTPVNAPTFTVDRDVTYDGLSSYDDTGFIPAQHALAWTLGNVRWAAYERTNVGTNTNVMGTTSLNAGGSVFRPRSTTNTLVTQLGSGTATFSSVTNSQSLTAVSRAGNGTTVKAYKAGVALTDVTGLAITGDVLSANPLFLGAGNTSGGTASAFRAAALGFACVGAPLSAGQETAQYNAVQAWATSVGAQV